MVELHAVADLAGLADDHAGAVIDEEVGSDRGAGMDVDAGAAVGPLGHHAREERDILAVEQMGDALDGDGLQTGIGEDDLLETARGGIARIGGLDIGLE